MRLPPKFEMELDRDLVGFSYGSVCPDHGDDESLRQWIADHASETTCNYCERVGKAPIAAPLPDFAEHVFRSILLEYGCVDDEGIPYDSGEGGYQTSILDTWDILIEEGVAHDEELLSDLTDAWQGQPWIRRGTWWLTEDEALAYGWVRFRRIVLYERRYWFHLAARDTYEPSAVPPALMLPAVGDAIEAAGLLRPLSKGEKVWRAHTHVPGERLEGARRLGAPPAECAANNRMSPTGIPIFYGAEKAATAESEARAAETDPKRNAVTLGSFEATRDLRLVDLCTVPAPSGLFDEERAYLRPIVRFLAEFTEEVSGPVRRDEREHPEYVPTQVFAEWLRFEFAPGGKELHGVRYRSAQADGVCIALFIGPGSAAESDENPTAEQVLRHTDTVRSNGD